VTPITLPDPSTSGPPLLPGLMAASVWIRPCRFAVVPVSLPTVMSRPRAEIIPVVTLLGKSVPSELPMAMASWPTWRFVESPIWAAVRPVAPLMRRMARSVRVSRP
jgi:hypothetical protein